jgi:hypothetical protein
VLQSVELRRTWKQNQKPPRCQSMTAFLGLTSLREELAGVREKNYVSYDTRNCSCREGAQACRSNDQ